MATETLVPDGLLQQDNLTGVLSYIQDDPDNPDGNWLTYITNNVDTYTRVSFPTPTGAPTQGTGLQNFKIWVRKKPGTGTPTVRIELHEFGVGLLATPLYNTNVTSSTGQLFSGAWDASDLTAPNGSLVECVIYGTAVSGAPATRCTVEVGAVEWNVTYSAITAVGDTVQGIWNVCQAVSDTSQFIYHVRTLASDTLQYIWNVKSVVADTIQSIWNVCSLATKSVQFIHHVKETIGDTSQYVWNVLASVTAVGDAIEFIWHAREILGKTSQSIWNIKATVNDTIQHIWNVYSLATKSAQFIYHVKETIGDTIQTIWNIRSAVGKTRELLWNVLTVAFPVGDILELIWMVKIRRLNIYTGISISQELGIQSQISAGVIMKVGQSKVLNLTALITEE